ncbi:MAG TPA: aminotransferase class III-fold pyridoxal phosphate-dependent enzyme [Candidatus Latescibacteria bacterium]|jgi:glutamate-1-semialdehyde 2,1-aminomutase|nr:aminotransferase class III [Gemmatimonadaceae bacterium]MDP6016290.1 aminotransferase class III-fold pyridoxal phosphate-dependent enzyme [Candidatus Latescibacterota bacterium]HJP33111.1 aminotransferase class III-fold pyridoxal phosphate-dependent enzyme [Candidatus Latescibacterota bacterium]
MTTPAQHASVTRSLEIYQRARQLIPGTTQLISRRPTRAALGFSPIYAESASGCRITDVDGNEFIDWSSAVGPIILGYANPVVDEAVKAQIDKGSVYSIVHESSVELAELLVRLVPSAEMVRYAKGGGEACTVAVRIARGVTGRDKVLFSGYHGWHDWYLAANLGEERLAGHLFNGIDPIGVPQGLEGTAMPFEYGDLDQLEDLLRANDSEVAAIIMEPMRTELPPEGYLEGVRALADRYGVVLIFDEVSCGWRISLGGVQQVAGVTPDLTVFAKAMSNGYPMAAVVGRRAVMEPVSRMFISSAYWDDNVGITAALATIRELERIDAPALFEGLGASFRERVDAAARQTGCPARCVGVAAHPRIQFDCTASQASKVATLFVQENARNGVILSGGFFFNAAHEDAEALDRTEAAVRKSFAVIADGLQRDCLDDLIECELVEESFRRLVQ